MFAIFQNTKTILQNTNLCIDNKSIKTEKAYDIFNGIFKRFLSTIK